MEPIHPATTRPAPLSEDALNTEVLVIGGGVMGAATALFLAEAGTRVTLVERADLAAGASYGNAGWVSASHGVLPGPGVTRKALGWLIDPESPLYIQPTLRPAMLRWLWKFWNVCDRESAKRAFALNRELSLASRACYEALAQRDDFDFGYRQQGLMVAFETREGLREEEEELGWLQEMGGEIKRLDATSLRDLEPSLSREMVGGVLFPTDAHVEPAPFVHQAGRAAAAAGARVCLGTEVLRIRSGARGVEAETTRGTFRAEQAVLAAGAWNTPLAKPLGCELPIEAAKGYSISVEKPEGFGERPVMLAEAKVGVSPMGGMLRFAGTLELAGIDQRVNLRRVGAVRKAAERCLPGAVNAPHLQTWRGLRPLTPDGLPILGRLSRHANVVVAGGHGMIGMCQGPISGQLVASLVRGETPALDLGPFRASRYGL